MTEEAFSLPFDRVRVGAATNAQDLSVNDFLKMPLPERIGHVLRREIEFFLGEAHVDRRRALHALRERAPRP